jgi:hypothetical protein
MSKVFTTSYINPENFNLYHIKSHILSSVTDQEKNMGHVWGTFIPWALKDAIHNTKFEINDNVIRTMRTWLHEQGKALYWQGIYTLIHHCYKAKQVDGHFVEK